MLGKSADDFFVNTCIIGNHYIEVSGSTPEMVRYIHLRWSGGTSEDVRRYKWKIGKHILNIYMFVLYARIV